MLYPAVPYPLCLASLDKSPWQGESARTPREFYGGAIKKVEKVLPAREKDRIPVYTPPAAQPLAALPPYGCGVSLAGAAARGLLNYLLLLQEPSRLPFCPRGSAPV